MAVVLSRTMSSQNQLTTLAALLLAAAASLAQDASVVEVDQHRVRYVRARQAYLSSHPDLTSHLLDNRRSTTEVSRELSEVKFAAAQFTRYQREFFHSVVEDLTRRIDVFNRVGGASDLRSDVAQMTTRLDGEMDAIEEDRKTLVEQLANIEAKGSNLSQSENLLRSRLLKQQENDTETYLRLSRAKRDLSRRGTKYDLAETNRQALAETFTKLLEIAKQQEAWAVSDESTTNLFYVSLEKVLATRTDAVLPQPLSGGVKNGEPGKPSAASGSPKGASRRTDDPSIQKFVGSWLMPESGDVGNQTTCTVISAELQLNGDKAPLKGNLKLNLRGPCPGLPRDLPAKATKNIDIKAELAESRLTLKLSNAKSGKSRDSLPIEGDVELFDAAIRVSLRFPGGMSLSPVNFLRQP